MSIILSQSTAPHFSMSKKWGAVHSWLLRGFRRELFVVEIADLGKRWRWVAFRADSACKTAQTLQTGSLGLKMACLTCVSVLLVLFAGIAITCHQRPSWRIAAAGMLSPPSAYRRGSEFVELNVAPVYRADVVLQCSDNGRCNDRLVCESNLVKACGEISGRHRKRMPDAFSLDGGGNRISVRDTVIRELVTNRLVHRERAACISRPSSWMPTAFISIMLAAP